MYPQGGAALPTILRHWGGGGFSTDRLGVQRERSARGKLGSPLPLCLYTHTPPHQLVTAHLCPPVSILLSPPLHRAHTVV